MLEETLRSGCSGQYEAGAWRQLDRSAAPDKKQLTPRSSQHHRSREHSQRPHRHVVTVYDFGITDNARGYLVMERLNGATLRETARRNGRLAPSRTLHVLTRSALGALRSETPLQAESRHCLRALGFLNLVQARASWLIACWIDARTLKPTPLVDFSEPMLALSRDRLSRRFQQLPVCSQASNPRTGRAASRVGLIVSFPCKPFTNCGTSGAHHGCTSRSTKSSPSPASS